MRMEETMYETFLRLAPFLFLALTILCAYISADSWIKQWRGKVPAGGDEDFIIITGLVFPVLTLIFGGTAVGLWWFS